MYLAAITYIREVRVLLAVNCVGVLAACMADKGDHVNQYIAHQFPICRLATLK